MVDLKTQPFIGLIATLATISLLATLFPILSFITRKEFRKHPSAYSIGRSVSDLGLSATFFSMYIWYPQAAVNHECILGGSLFFTFFIAGCEYYMAICWDLYFTVSDPFRKPASGATFAHVIIWVVAIVFPFAYGANNDFAYRKEYEICFSKNQGGISTVNTTSTVLLYIPICISNLIGVVTNFYIWRRLRGGLSETLELRRAIIYQQTILVIFFTVISVVGFCVWISVVWVPGVLGNASYNAYAPLIIAFTVLGMCLTDCVVWWVNKYQMSCQFAQRFYEPLISFEDKTIDHTEPVAHAQQNISNALRLEVVLHMVTGVANCVRRTAELTSQRDQNERNFDHGCRLSISSDGSRMTDAEDPSRLGTMRGKFNHSNNPLDCPEPPPAVVDYPRNLDQDPDVNTSVNEVEFSVGTDMETVKCKEYAPHVFRYMRNQVYGIDDQTYLDSIFPGGESEAATQIANEKFSEGRSGAFFFYTQDAKFLVKTVDREEATLLLRILENFLMHMQTNPKSFVNKFFGLHSIEMYGRTILFVILDNVFVPNVEPHEKYDIKGSWIDRHTDHRVEDGKLMKDQDLHKTLALSEDKKSEVWAQVRRDTSFLRKQNIMDYSLLLGIYYVAVDPNYIQQPLSQLAAELTDASDGYIPPEISVEDELARQDSLSDELGPDERIELQNMPSDLNTQRSMSQEESWTATRRRALTFHRAMRTVGVSAKAIQPRTIEGPGIYYIGIIDTLQEWTLKKKMERFLKINFRCKDPNGISCVEPTFYRKRFLRKMFRIGLGAER